MRSLKHIILLLVYILISFHPLYAKKKQNISERIWVRINSSSKHENNATFLTSDVDKNIPSGTKKCEDIMCLAIGNQNYEFEQESPYSANDSKTFSKYCESLGIEAVNVMNASYAKFKASISNYIIKGKLRGARKLIFYYSGHGVLTEKNELAMVPTDYDKNSMGEEFLLPISTIYEQFNNSFEIVILLDACAIKQKKVNGKGIIMVDEASCPSNVTIISASTFGEKAFPYNQEAHGIFSYYVLKAIQERGAVITTDFLIKYLLKNVPSKAFDLFQQPQTPQILNPKKKQTIFIY